MIEKVLNLGHDNPFENITTYPAIIVLSNNKKRADVSVYNKNYKADYIIKGKDYLIDGCYFFASSSELKFLNEIFECKKKNCDIFVRNGLATNADWFFYDKNFSGEYIIDAIKSSKAQETKLFFPYNKNGELVKIADIKIITQQFTKNY
ncbi:hypothetical protein [Spiroplasma clarkii]|uniref:hypothetical protein n=1 Tax=Spiroplasma clarkii TaxID=2139 RepID=UPI0011BA97FF|nr:hypothetical protein [Spiroplasma clarkii]